MSPIDYDVSRVATSKPNGRVPEQKIKAPDPRSFAARVSGRRVDLVDLIENGVPPVDYLPESDGMLVRGGVHQIVAPKKSGKSMATLVHTTRMALAGAVVVTLDRENGKHVYARRLEGILEDCEIGDEDREMLRNRLIYVEFPKLRRTDSEDLTDWVVNDLGADLMVFDSQRMFLTDLDLREDDSDDYTEFIVSLIDPLKHRGVTTLLLDNSGHSGDGRARGTSSKGDLLEVLFTLDVVQPFSMETSGQLKLSLEPGSSRHGNEGQWIMTLGGGKFGEWVSQPASGERIKAKAKSLSEGERQVLDHLREHAGDSQTATVKALLGGGRLSHSP
jgi:hypothetical protein